MLFLKKHTGVWIALTIILLWLISTWLLISRDPVFSSPWTYVFILIQTHLYTGLFITAHDAMHGVVSPHKKLNNILGWVSASLFAWNYYAKLYPKHHEHHRHVATDKDPDYHASGNFFIWYLSFVRQYVSIFQIVLMACTYHVLILFFPRMGVITFWIIPSILATLQLFFFGTYLPHRGEHGSQNKHKARSQRLNHLWAFLSCYFFGYHYEHHNSPGTPWWRLWKVKEESENKGLEY